MKVCEDCGCEIDGLKDGENKCSECDGKARKSAKARANRREKDSIMRSMGLVKVKGSMGGTY